MEKCSMCQKPLSSYFETSNSRKVEYNGETITVCFSCRGGVEDDTLIELLKTKQQENVGQAEIQERTANMILSTTPTIEGVQIKQYLGIVNAQSVEGVNAFKDLFGGVRNIVGGRSKALQGAMKKMREEAMQELREEAVTLGANAVVGVTIDFDEYMEGMLMLTIVGTAVVI